ncbi:Protein adenylyltransferase SelO, mitochondrial [Psilocybe cubensis]|uniref:Protein adenylyltransferase SelO, mitochondrial n=2 Tax=Psilocybe cubensis TaxID=181762 RepID=A0ACB8H1Q0_PSICU|nr:Protein adenylyltransferase SelO, mitochondrial [Psilocybe cubensis]KAH9481619.1 Protein adenylyltransferase SelO, mitochondrial [Psilocybe cubensis]
MSSTRFTVSALPLAQKSQLLIHNLTPDTYTPTPAHFQSKVLVESPSIQRRARLLPGPCHFSHVSPFPIPFPYDIEPPVPAAATDDKASYIEKWLADREAVHILPSSEKHPDAPLRKYAAKNRDQPLDLIGISETGLRDCVPHLDVGDAFAVLGVPSLAHEFDDEGDPQPSDIKDVVDARQDLIDVLSGQYMLMSSAQDDSNPNHIPFAPWSLRYSGHQFGSWAGQLGDGRAITIHVTPHPSDPEMTYELQLKGSGRTPFSRSADGLAVLRSSIREYLCSEAMEALHIPTTRSLSLISLPALPVQRERVETACVLTRMAPSFLRIGNFEAFNGPTNMFFFGGGQQKPDYEGLRVLGEWVAGKVLKLNIEPGKAWGSQLVLEVARRNAKMVAGWQAYGFMHGVINTDNVSVLGLTIDYGPYAFMDVFDPQHICNHTDESGRYAYKYQPNMIVYAIRALLNALSPLIGAEAELGGKAVSTGWADGVTSEKLEEWNKSAQELKSEAERVVQEIASVEYGRLMRKRLGLRRQDASDESEIFKPLLEILEQHRLDFHSTFRTLSSFRPSLLSDKSSLPDSDTESGDLQSFIAKLLGRSGEPERLDHAAASSAWLTWLDKYAARIRSEAGEWTGVSGEAAIDAEREKEMKGVNPRFVLRQWVLEEVISRVERDSTSGKRVLAKVMQMACNPYEPWGAEDEDQPDSELDKEEKEERRYCGLGEKKMLGFQCSCSS